MDADADDAYGLEDDEEDGEEEGEAGIFPPDNEGSFPEEFEENEEDKQAKKQQKLDK